MDEILSDSQRKAVLGYVYHGGDNSPIYKHILSPFAQFWVDYFTPRWLAPNVITLLGLLTTLAAAVVTLRYCSAFFISIRLI